MDYKDFKQNTGSLFGNIARDGASRLYGAFKGVDKDKAKDTISKGLYDNVIKPVTDTNKNLGKAVSDTPLLGGLFKTPGGKDSFIEPMNKAKKVALPMLATAGLSKVVNDRRKQKKRKIEDKIQQNTQQLVGRRRNKMAEISPDLLEKTAQKLEELEDEKEKMREKLASKEAQIDRREETFDKLVKLAERERISWPDIPEMLEKFAGLDDDEYNVEMRVLEKTASSEFLNIGDLGDDHDRSVEKAEDLFTNFVSENGSI